MSAVPQFVTFALRHNYSTEELLERMIRKDIHAMNILTNTDQRENRYKALVMDNNTETAAGVNHCSVIRSSGPWRFASPDAALRALKGILEKTLTDFLDVACQMMVIDCGDVERADAWPMKVEKREG